MSNITENDYLELANHSKELYEKQEVIIKKLNQIILNLRKEIVSCYGFVRTIDELTDELIENETDNSYYLTKHPVQTLLELLRSRLSSLTEAFLT